MSDIAKVTELDFNTIKKNLKDYFNRADSPFRDWDFEGSGLSYLLDILAYNTHYNAVNAHLSMNESFLDSAQIRSNAVSRAKLIGYTPRSRRGARAVIRLSFPRSGEFGPDVLVLPKGTLFQTSIDGTNYSFSTDDDYETVFNTATDLYTFDNVSIIQGELKTQRFIVNESIVNQKFIINDQNIDTSTIDVNVYPHTETTENETYLNGDMFSSYDSESRVYFLTENYEGRYQIDFGDGIIGKKLDNLSVVEVNFLSSVGAFANGARNFRFIRAPIGSVFPSGTSPTEFDVLEPAYGGDERESIEEIRQVAPYSFITQNRAVTTSDYETLIRENISDIDEISVWGGQDNIPPIYGKTFISIKPKAGFYLKNAQREEIIRYLNSVKMLTNGVELVDPNYIYLYFDVFFKYDPNLTSLTVSELQSRVKESIIEFNENTLGGFDKVFRYSNFLSIIDSTDEAILNSFARVYVYKDLNLTVSEPFPEMINFNLKLFGEVSQKESIISSSSWKYNNFDLFLADEPIQGETALRKVYAYRMSTDGSTRLKVFSDLGRLDINTGKLELQDIPTVYDTTISIRAIADSYDVATVRNQLITIDIAETTVIGDIDDTRNTGAADRRYDPISRFRD